MSRLRSEVLGWFDGGRVVSDRERDVLLGAGLAPTAAEWRAFLGHLTLWLGTVALAAAAIFFFAFNWADLSRFAKLGLVEGAMVVALLALWPLGLDKAPGKAVLLLLSLLTGALLALTGQIYQTGADTYELFAWWAVLILPWVLVGRFSSLWLVWLALLNLAAWAYLQRSSEPEPLLWALFAINTLALVAWEAARRAGVPWLRESWPPRLIAVASGVMATSLAVWGIVGSSALPAGEVAAIFAYVAWVGATYVWYRRVRPDLFMLAGGVLSLVVVVATVLSDTFLDAGSGAFLIIGLVVIGMAGGGAVWLKSVAREHGAQQEQAA